MGFESCFWLIDSRSLVCHYKWYLIWKPWDVATSCSQMQPDGSWFVSTRYFFFSKYHLFFGGVGGHCKYSLPSCYEKHNITMYGRDITAKTWYLQSVLFPFVSNRGSSWLKPCYLGTPCNNRTLESFKGGPYMRKYVQVWWKMMTRHVTVPTPMYSAQHCKTKNLAQ